MKTSELYCKWVLIDEQSGKQKGKKSFALYSCMKSTHKMKNDILNNLPIEVECSKDLKCC